MTPRGRICMRLKRKMASKGRAAAGDEETLTVRVEDGGPRVTVGGEAFHISIGDLKELYNLLYCDG